MAIPLVHFIQWKNVRDDELDATMAHLADAGVQSIVVHPEWAKRDQQVNGYLKTIYRKMRQCGLSGLACHGLWGQGFDLNFPNEDRRKQLVAAHCSFLEKAAEMGSLTYTVHLGERDPEYPAAYLNGQVRKSLDEMIAKAEQVGIKVALENMIDYDSGRELASLVSEYHHPALGLCLDTGHAHIKEGVAEALENMRNHLFTCHLHDNDGTADQHCPPGYGSIDWESLIPTLKACPALINAETEAGPCANLKLEEVWQLFQDAWVLSRKE